jgi:hypothetical protein
MDNKPIFSLDPDQLKRLFSLGTGAQDAAEEQNAQADAPGQGEAPPAGVAPSADVTASLVGKPRTGSAPRGCRGPADERSVRGVFGSPR